MKTLFVISPGMNKPPDDKIRFRERSDLQPRVKLLEDLICADVLDERFLKFSVPAYRKFFYWFMPIYVAQIIEAFIIQKKYSGILSYYEKVGLPLALLQRIFRSKTPHVLMTSWLSAKKKMWFLSRVHQKLAKIILWSTVQYQIALDELDIPSHKLKLLKYGVDQKFWRPIKSKEDIISSAGMEMRDYPTLIEALRSVDIPCQIATGLANGELYNTVKQLYKIEDLPANVTIEKKNFFDLRKMYARSRFVVIPLLPTDTDNGITVMLEAMAMGKTVVCSEVEGQVDLLQHGITGLFVPQGDPAALRKVILELWENPEKCRKMGEAAREYILKHHTLEQFSEAIAKEVCPVMVQPEVKKLKHSIAFNEV